MEHVDYPHESGTLYDCLACEEYKRERIAVAAGVNPSDVLGSFGEYTIDGMDWEEWIDAVYGDN